MQVVLNENVKNLGFKGDVVAVKPGYAMNFLIPRGMADMATASRIKIAESRKEKMVMEREEMVANAKDVLDKLAGLSITIEAKVTEKGTLYGAISEADVAEAIKKAAKIQLEVDQLKMEHIKEVGEHKVTIHLGKDLDQEVTVTVIAE